MGKSLIHLPIVGDSSCTSAGDKGNDMPVSDGLGHMVTAIICLGHSPLWDPIPWSPY